MDKTRRERSGGFSLRWRDGLRMRAELAADETVAAAVVALVCPRPGGRLCLHHSRRPARRNPAAAVRVHHLSAATCRLFFSSFCHSVYFTRIRDKEAASVRRLRDLIASLIISSSPHRERHEGAADGFNQFTHRRGREYCRSATARLANQSEFSVESDCTP